MHQEAPTIVVVDDQKEMRDLLRELFTARGREVMGFGDGADALDYLGEHEPAVELVVLDLDLGSGRENGIEICHKIHDRHADLPIIILTGDATVDRTIASMRAGAVDVVVKDPYLEETLELSVDKVERMMAQVRELRRLEGEMRSLKQANERLRDLAGSRWEIVGESKKLVDVLARVARVAPIPRPVLVLGERGTGKELVARAIHNLSARSTEPYVTINCAAVSESLLESELFGHEEGAFTGATRQKEGKFELADGGTLFLDEIGNMSLEFQAKILRVLEYQRFERVAGAESIQVDVRVIAATNADLDEAMERGTFRRDLYDRLAFEEIRLPPLRDRREDLPSLVAHFLERFSAELSGLRPNRIEAAALDRLGEYDFPGNVRELKNIIERAAYTCEDTVLRLADIDAALPPGGRGSGHYRDDPSRPLPARVESFEKALCEQALAESRYNQKEAAEALGITYDQFRQRYRKYNLGKS